VADEDLSPGAIDALRELKGARGACPAAAELIAYEALTDGDRARHPLHAHVSICSRCQLVLLHAGPERPGLLAGPERSGLLAGSERPGLRHAGPERPGLHAGSERPGLRTDRRPGLLGPATLAIAAAIVLAIALPFMLRTSQPRPLTPDTIRGSELQPIAPSGTVASVPRFEWQSPIEAHLYRVTVYRDAKAVWSATSQTTTFTPDLPPVFPPGDYTWQVEAFDRAGDVRMTSPRQSFTIR
jgi:hypothetical protein